MTFEQYQEWLQNHPDPRVREVTEARQRRAREINWQLVELLRMKLEFDLDLNHVK